MGPDPSTIIVGIMLSIGVIIASMQRPGARADRFRLNGFWKKYGIVIAVVAALFFWVLYDLMAAS
jgi:hypothetical protein